LDPTVIENRNTVDVHRWRGPAGIGSGYFKWKKDNPGAEDVMAPHVLCIVKPGPGLIGGPEIARESISLVESLRGEGALAAGGRTEEDPDLAAVIVFKTGLREEAARSLEQDPAVRSGHLAVEYHTWWSADRVLPW
jgi:hypothetical protein